MTDEEKQKRKISQKVRNNHTCRAFQFPPLHSLLWLTSNVLYLYIRLALNSDYQLHVGLFTRYYRIRNDVVLSLYSWVKLFVMDPSIFSQMAMQLA